MLYSGPGGLVAHECILDLRPLKEATDIAVDDVAKRLIDYGFHAPTMSFPVAGTLMVEPTESESKAELDRFIDAMIAIRGEIRAVAEGRADRVDNVLKHAPHTAAAVTADELDAALPARDAAYPVASLREAKYWPPVARVDNVYGDRNLFCSCPPVAAADGSVKSRDRMTLASLNRWKASALHLALSAAIAVAVVTLMLAVWYPQPYFAAMGGATLIMLLIGVDVVIGPLDHAHRLRPEEEEPAVRSRGDRAVADCRARLRLQRDVHGAARLQRLRRRPLRGHRGERHRRRVAREGRARIPVAAADRTEGRRPRASPMIRSG